jgi:hypothetical protein
MIGPAFVDSGRHLVTLISTDPISPDAHEHSLFSWVWRPLVNIN